MTYEEKAKLVQAKHDLKFELQQYAWFRGIGIGQDGIKVNVDELTDEVLEVVPETVKGINVTVEAVGSIRPQQ